jgi:hypothetical protein
MLHNNAFVREELKIKYLKRLTDYCYNSLCKKRLLVVDFNFFSLSCALIQYWNFFAIDVFEVGIHFFWFFAVPRYVDRSDFLNQWSVR